MGDAWQSLGGVGLQSGYLCFCPKRSKPCARASGLQAAVCCVRPRLSRFHPTHSCFEMITSFFVVSPRVCFGLVWVCRWGFTTVPSWGVS